MKKRIWALVLLAVVAAGGLYFWNTDASRDRRVWRRFAAELTEKNVANVEFGAAKAMTLSESDRREILGLLQVARFDRSNRAGEGPTPQAIISITFTDGRKVNIGMWGMTTYELSPRHLDPDSQFLIMSEELGIWLRNHFTGPAIGAGGHAAPGAVSS
ncbi:MAG TPA: hypothetical protein VD969_02255 [Symbiobacteriaceae bacterium]|nr:hypothetical protein [Symbiobacteriaceae bacterium]